MTFDGTWRTQGSHLIKVDNLIGTCPDGITIKYDAEGNPITEGHEWRLMHRLNGDALMEVIHLFPKEAETEEQETAPRPPLSPDPESYECADESILVIYKALAVMRLDIAAMQTERDKLAEACQIFTQSLGSKDGYIAQLGVTKTREALQLMKDCGVGWVFYEHQRQLSRGTDEPEIFKPK